MSSFMPAERARIEDEVRQATGDLEALTSAYEACRRDLEDLEAITDALLDDAHWCVLVLEADLRVRAVSRGMADDLGFGPSAVGQRLVDVAPSTWSRLAAALAEASHGSWGKVPLDDGDDGVLCARRVTESGREPIYVVRYEACS